mgnify:CR=1 FL=1
MDRALTFGSKSSPGIYDGISNIVRDIANMRAGNARTAGFKCLDDTGVIGTYEECKAFYRENRGVCSRVGVKLAPDEDLEKAFGLHFVVGDSSVLEVRDTAVVAGG